MADAAPVTLVEAGADGTLYAFVSGTGLMISAGGANWKLAAPAEAFDGALIHLTAAAGGPAYAVTQFMKILSSGDGGRAWAAFAQ